jgi:hypothetical protein
MYENKNYDKKAYPKLVLNKLKVMGGFTPIYTPLGTYLKGWTHIMVTPFGAFMGLII